MKKFKTQKKINRNKGEYIHDQVNRNQIHWFPGHMHKALKQIKERIKSVDIVLEIRDARSPLATGNNELTKLLVNKGHLIICNKSNLADPSVVKQWQQWFTQQRQEVLFLNGLNKKEVLQIIRRAKDIVYSRRQQSNPDHKIRKNFKLMVIGLPNTGKSTIINQLAGRNATKVANRPGQTQQQIWIKIDNEITMLDTPGVMPPKIAKEEHGIWLAALHAIADHIVPAERPACYIIEQLLQKNYPLLQQRYSLPTQTEFQDLANPLIEVLDAIAHKIGALKRGGIIDYERVYNTILTDFRKGELGQISFGTPPTTKD